MEIGEGKEVKLLGAWFSPFVYRVIWVLKMKGIEYDYLEQDVYNNKSSLLLETNPVHKKVPVLLHNGKPISESLIIIEYLEETRKNNPILPQDPYQRAMARFWAKFAEDKFTEVARKVLLLGGEEQEKAVKEAKEALEILEGELKGNKFFGGETIGLVDVVLGVIAVWLGPLEEVACVKVFDSFKYPSLSKWMGDFSEVAVIKENLPARDSLAPGLHELLAGLQGVESGQDAIIRTYLYEPSLEVVHSYNLTVAEFTSRISELRNRLGMCGIKDEGIIVPPQLGAENRTDSNVLSANFYSISYQRCAAPATSTWPGGFYPRGGNGRITRELLKATD